MLLIGLIPPARALFATFLIQTHVARDATVHRELSHPTSTSYQENVPLTNISTDQADGRNCLIEIPSSHMCP